MKKLLFLMEELPKNLDAALVTSDINRRYYTEFMSSAGTLIVTREESYLLIDSRYYDAAKQDAKNCTVVLQVKLFEQIEELLLKHGARNVGIEADTVSVSFLEEYTKRLPNFNIISDRSLSQTIVDQRKIKCPIEKSYIEKSQAITDKTFDYALTIIKEGMTEIEIALAMEMYSRQNGSEEPAFSFIVAAGPSSARPHAVPSNNTVKKGDFVLLDFGCTYMGYRSDMTRTVAVGEPSQKQKDVYFTVLAAQKEAMKHIKAGVDMKSIHDIALDYINATPYKGLFTHGLGHSFGLDVHESPNFNPTETATAEAGIAISVEPGIYISGEFGVRIEDTIYITEDGFENFTASPKEELIVL